MRKYYFIALLMAPLCLNACTNTFEGIKNDLNKIGNSISQTTENITQPKTDETASMIQQGEPCPPIIVKPTKDTIIEYQDARNPSDTTMVSSFTLTSTQSTCAIEGDFVAMQIDLGFDGKMGPKAKRRDGDQPFFSYPYFIAVSDLSGNELAREYFAANVTYENDETQVSMVETIRQRLPLQNGNVPYNVEVGFQLTDDQVSMLTPR